MVPPYFEGAESIFGLGLPQFRPFKRAETLKIWLIIPKTPKIPKTDENPGHVEKLWTRHVKKGEKMPVSGMLAPYGNALDISIAYCNEDQAHEQHSHEVSPEGIRRHHFGYQVHCVYLIGMSRFPPPAVVAVLPHSPKAKQKCAQVMGCSSIGPGLQRALYPGSCLTLALIYAAL